MGKYKKGILGSFRGKVGTVIGAVWNGIYYMRSVSDYVNANPSESQLNVRLRFALVAGFLKMLKGTIKTGYQQFNQGMTPMNAASSYLLKNAITGVAPNYTLDYAKVLLSIGDLEGPELPEVETLAPAKLVFAWTQDLNMEFGKPTDTATFVVYNETKNRAVVANTSVMRSALTYEMQLPAAYIGDTVQVYMSFVSSKGVSTSAYLGELVVV